MKFDRIVGKIDPKIIQDAQAKMTLVFLELGAKSTNDSVGTYLGGDPLIFALVVPAEHVATLNIPTAATDGKRFYWNPKWVASRNITGLRLTCYHESAHALYMHYQRRGNRDPRLWNIAVDFIVNGMIMDDLKIRHNGSLIKVHNTFTMGLGNYLTLSQCIEWFKNPFVPIKGMENFIPEPEDPHKIAIPDPENNKELTEEEQKAIDDRIIKFKFYYADPNLSEDMKKPEKIYDALLHASPKCPECGKIGMYPIPQQSSGGGKSGESKSSKENKDDKSKGTASGEEPGACGTCGGGFDILDVGDMVDEHIDTKEELEVLAKRMSDAIKAAKQMAGRVPQGLEAELGLLTASRIRWQDFIRTKLTKCRAGNSKNDWTRFRSRPMFAGLMIPKRTGQVVRFACLLDTSISMTSDDMAFGVSQLSSLDERSEGIIIPADSQIYWEQASKIRSPKTSELTKIKVIGRGGTKYAEFFTDYEKRVGKMDFLIVISDGFLLTDDVAQMIDPEIDVIWLITSGSAFNAPFGRVFDLKSL